MSTTTSRADRNLAHLISEEADASHISLAQALTQHRLDLGAKLAAALLTADEFNGAGRPGLWVQDEMDAARRYAAELQAIADWTAQDINAIVALDWSQQARASTCPGCGGSYRSQYHLVACRP